MIWACSIKKLSDLCGVRYHYLTEDWDLKYQKGDLIGQLVQSCVTLNSSISPQVAHRLCFRSVTDLFLRVCKLFGVKHFYRLSYRSVTDP